MPNWTRLARTADCPPGSSQELIVDERIIALFNVDGTFYALDGICPHQGGPLGQGRLTGTTVTCPWHGWQFDVTSGRHLLGSLVQPHYEVRVDDEWVMVDLG